MSSRTRTPGSRLIAVAGAFAALALAGCGGSDASGPDISGTWARTSPASATVGAVYATISVDTDDRLMSVSVDPSVAAAAEVHEMVPVEGTDHDEMHEAMHGDDEEMADHDEMSSEDMEQMEMPMQMQEVEDGIAIAAGENLVLEPGSYHIMLIDLAAPLEVGSTVDVTLSFENAGDVELEIPVRDSAP